MLTRNSSSGIARALTPLLVLGSTVGAVHAQQCYTLQQDYPNLLTSTVNEAGALVTLSQLGTNGPSIQFHTFDQGSELYISDPTVGTLPSSTNGFERWNLDFVGSYVVAGSGGVFQAPGDALVTRLDSGGFTNPTGLRDFVPPGPPPGGFFLSSDFGADVATAVTNEGVLAFVGDPNSQDFGAVYVFDITDPINPVFLTQLTAPGQTGTQMYGASVDTVETMQGGIDEPFTLIVAAPEYDFNDEDHVGAAFIYDVSYLGGSLIVSPPVLIPNPLLGTINATSDFADSVGIGEDYAIVSMETSPGSMIAYTYQRTAAGWIDDNTFFGSDNVNQQVHISRTGLTAIVGIFANVNDAVYTRSGSTWTPAFANVEANTNLTAGGSVTDDALSLTSSFLYPSGGRAVGRFGCSTAAFRELSGSVLLCSTSGADQGFPNTTGEVGEMNISGSFTGVDMLTVTTSKLPNFSFAFHSTALEPASFAPTNMWRSCLGQLGIQRYSNLAGNTGNNGTYSADLPIGMQYGADISAMPGLTVYFQTWHRDSVGGMAVFNFSEALGIRLFP